MIQGIRQVGQIVQRSIAHGEGEKEYAVLQALAEEPPRVDANDETSLLCILDIDTHNDQIEGQIVEVDDERVQEFLWVGDAASNADQDRVTTRNLKYLVSQTLPNLYNSEDASEGLEELLEPVMSYLVDIGEDVKDRYRYLLDLRGLGFAVDWNKIESESKKKRRDAAADALREALDLPDDEISLYTVSIDGFPLAKEPHYHDYLFEQMVEQYFSEGKKGTCHLCGAAKVPTTSQFPKARLKLFINEKLNFASPVRGGKRAFDSSYSLCQECYETILLGEAFILRRLDTYTLQSTTHLVPELSNPSKMSAEGLERLAERVTQQVKALNRITNVPDMMEYFDRKQDYYQVTLLLSTRFQAGRKVLEVIPEVPPSQIQDVVESIGSGDQAARSLWGSRKGDWGWFAGIGDLLRILPVRVSQDGPEVRPAVRMAKRIILSQPVDATSLRGDVLEVARAIHYDQGQFFNHDSDVHTYIPRCLTLELILQDLDLIQDRKSHSEGATMAEKIPEPYSNILDELRFGGTESGLFLLGVLTGRVGWAQYTPKSNKKPILSKINYQGMSKNRLQSFAVDLFESMQHYGVMDADSERLHGLARSLIDGEGDKWPLTDKENVYYLLSGYSIETQRRLEELDEHDGDQNNSDEEHAEVTA